MSISVVIPAYNEEKYIEETLQSIQKQTVTPLEIIVVDNNSTDNTAAIAKKYGAKVIIEKNQGHVFALSRGMSEASGDIIAVTDADTIVPAHWLELLSKQLEKDDVAGVAGAMDVRTGKKSLDKIITTLYHGFMHGNSLLGKPHINGFCFAVKRDIFNKIGGIDKRYRISSDVDLGIRLSKYGKVVYLPELAVVTSTRRWHKNPNKVFMKYLRAYFYAVWFRKPPPFQLNSIR